MLTWNNGWSEKHCGLERKTVQIWNAFSSQQRPVLASWWWVIIMVSHREQLQAKNLRSETRGHFWFRSPDQPQWASSPLTGEAQHGGQLCGRWKLWTSPIHAASNRASQKLLQRGGRVGECGPEDWRFQCSLEAQLSLRPATLVTWWRTLSHGTRPNKAKLFPTSPLASPGAGAKAASLMQVWRFTVWTVGEAWKWASATINWEPEGFCLSRSTLIQF